MCILKEINEITIKKTIIDDIAKIKDLINDAINKDFWKITSDKPNCYIVGSYGRGTAINTKNVDLLVILQEIHFDTNDKLKDDIKAQLKDTIEEAIKKSHFPKYTIKIEDLVIKIEISDELGFVIIPGFYNKKHNTEFAYDKYIHLGYEIEAKVIISKPDIDNELMYELDKMSNGLLYDTCKYMRCIKDMYNKDVHISDCHLYGFVIDFYVYNFIKNNSCKKIITSTGDINVSYVDNTGTSKICSEEEYVEILFRDYTNYICYKSNDTFVKNPSDEYVVACKDRSCLVYVLAIMYNLY